MTSEAIAGRVRVRATLAAIVCVGLAVTSVAQGPTQQELNGAADNTTDWLVTNHDYGGQRFVDLDLINKSNVGSLQPLCVYETDDRGPFHTHPLIYQGVMYLTVSLATVALDATDCREIWRHEWEPKARRNYPMHRGVAIKDGVVVRGTLDGYLLAFDSASGELLWDTPAADAADGESFTMPPLIFEDLVLIGPAGAEAGVRGWVGAFSLEDGSEVWRFNTIPQPGEPGSETWEDPASDLIGGGALWTPFSLDPEAGLVFAAVSNPAPDFYGEGREGDNLYTASLIALDVRTGELVWYDQAVPHDVHDWDLTHAAPLFTTTINGERRQAITSVGKEGMLRVIDRASHERLYEVPVTRRENTGAPVTVAGVRACPGVLGGVEWNGPAYNPPLDMLYTPAVDWCGEYRRAEEFDGRRWLGGGYGADNFDDARGVITAVDATTGTRAWSYQSPHPMLAAITTTSAELLFTGELTGDFLALDASDGSVLFRHDTGAPNNGGVATYAIEGTQYIALMAGNTSPLWPSIKSAASVIIYGLP